MGEKRFDELQLAQLTTGELDDILVESILKMHHGDEPLLVFATLRGVIASKRVSALYGLGHGGCLLVDVVLVPAQLQVVGAVGLCTVAVTEGYVAHAVGGHLPPHLLHATGLAAGVGTYYGDNHKI